MINSVYLLVLLIAAAIVVSLLLLCNRHEESTESWCGEKICHPFESTGYAWGIRMVDWQALIANFAVDLGKLNTSVVTTIYKMSCRSLRSACLARLLPTAACTLCSAWCAFLTNFGFPHAYIHICVYTNIKVATRLPWNTFALKLIEFDTLNRNSFVTYCRYFISRYSSRWNFSRRT